MHETPSYSGITKARHIYPNGLPGSWEGRFEMSCTADAELNNYAVTQSDTSMYSVYWSDIWINPTTLTDGQDNIHIEATRSWCVNVYDRLLAVDQAKAYTLLKGYLSAYGYANGNQVGGQRTDFWHTYGIWAKPDMMCFEAYTESAYEPTWPEQGIQCSEYGNTGLGGSAYRVDVDEYNINKTEVKAYFDSARAIVMAEGACKSGVIYREGRGYAPEVQPTSTPTRTPTRTPTFTPTATRTPTPLPTFTPTPFPTRWFTIYKHVDTQVSVATVNNWINTGNTYLMNVDPTLHGQQDYATNVRMHWNGTINNFGTSGDGHNNIELEQEKTDVFNTLLAAPGGHTGWNVKVLIVDNLYNGAANGDTYLSLSNHMFLIVKSPAPDNMTFSHETRHVCKGPGEYSINLFEDFVGYKQYNRVLRKCLKDEDKTEFDNGD